MTNEKDESRTFTEQFEVAGDQLLSTVKALFDDANARRLTIRGQDGRELLAMPLTAGIAGGALAFMVAPVLTVVAAIGGALANVTLEVEREPDR